MNLNTNINDESIDAIKKISRVPSTEALQESSSKVDTGLSTIEKSKSVVAISIPPMDAPILQAPSADPQFLTFVMTSVDANGRPMIDILRSIQLKVKDVNNEVLAKWAENLREIAEQVSQLLRSPIYQQLLEIRMKGDPHVDQVSGIQGPSAANAAAGKDPISFLSTLDRLQVLERIPSTAKVEDTSSAQTSYKESSQALVIPLTAAMMIGGALALGSTEITASISGAASSSLSHVVELVSRLQPLLPQMSIENVIPLINLMVAAPIIYHSWDEAVSNYKNNERHNYVKIVQNFARDVLRMVGDANFISTTVNKMEGTDRLTSDDQNRLSRMLKIILIGVALGLLFNVEVGKVQEGKFGGLEPEELRDLLIGDLGPQLDPKKKPTVQQELTMSLINRAREQLALLSPKDRMEVATLLLEYLGKTREFEPMLEPAKIYEETLAAAGYKSPEQANMLKA